MGSYVRAVLLGHMHYYAVPMNAVSVSNFPMALGRVWRRVLKRRSQKSHLPWGSDGALCCTLAAAYSHLSFLILGCALWCHYLGQEPDKV